MSIERELDALLLASPQPISIKKIEERAGRSINEEIDRLKSFWSGRGMQIKVSDGHISMLPSQEALKAVSKNEKISRRKLSEAAIETLCFIAVHQPVTLKEIEEARDISLFRGVIDSLLDSGFIRASSRKTNSGRAVVYVTTDAFLDHFNLSSLLDLPTVDEIKSLISNTCLI